MDKFIKAFVDLKIPSIIIVALFALLTYNLLKNSPKITDTAGIAGIVCLGVMIFCGVYSFIENIIKERYVSIINMQQTAMENISKTHTIIEQNKQDAITSSLTKETRKQYTEVDPRSETEI